MVTYFEDEEIIPDQHHRGRQRHLRLTTKMAIDKAAADKIDNCGQSILFATDLSQAFDLVSHEILIDKLRFHGVNENGCKLMET